MRSGTAASARSRAGSGASMRPSNRGFDRFRDFYIWMLQGLLARRIIAPLVAGAVLLAAACMAPFVGTDFFPQVDAGVIQLHVRAPARTRIEETEKVFQQVENQIRATIPEKDRNLILDNIGLPQRTDQPGVHRRVGDRRQ